MVLLKRPLNEVLLLPGIPRPTFYQTPDGCYSLRQGSLFSTIILTLYNTYSSGPQSVFFFWK